MYNGDVQFESERVDQPTARCEKTWLRHTTQGANHETRAVICYNCREKRMYKGPAAANQQEAAGNRPRLKESGPIPVWQMPQERQEHGHPTHVQSEGRASKNPLWILQFLCFREVTPEAKIIGEHWGVADSASRPLSNPPKRETRCL